MTTLKLRGRFTVWFLLAACGSRVFAQTPARDNRGDRGPVVLRTTTRLVQINVIVHDKKGKPVEGLKQEDFTILDQGKEQKVSTFSAISAALADTSSIPPLPPNVFSNRGGTSAANPGSVTVILFDALNTPIQDQQLARFHMLKILRQLHPQDHVAIYVLTTQLITLNEFTQDATSLLQAIQKFGGSSSALEEAANRAAAPVQQTIVVTQTPEADLMSSHIRDFLTQSDGVISDFANINRAETTTNAIAAIANHVARIPGRKSLVWISASFPINIGFDGQTLSTPRREQRSFTEELEHAARALNQANMAIYPVDPRGLMTSPGYDVTNGALPNPQHSTAGLSPDQGNFDTMLLLADRTGGRAFYNTNDIEGSVQKAISDGQYTYTLGFYPSHGKWDGRFHELKVHVNEKGLTLRHRKGYFALPEPPSGAEENKATLEAAIASPVEWTNLNVAAAVKDYETTSHALSLQVALDTHELNITSKDGRWSDTILVLFEQHGAGDKLITSDKEKFDLNLLSETYQKLMIIGTKFSGQILLAPDVVNVRVIVQDSGSGSVGTITIPIKQYLATLLPPSGISLAPQ